MNVEETIRQREALRRDLFGPRDHTGDTVMAYLERHPGRTLGDASDAVAYLLKHRGLALEQAGELVASAPRPLSLHVSPRPQA